MSPKKQLLLGVAIGTLLAATPAMAADMPVKAAPVPVAAVSDPWSGWYWGGNIGYSWGNAKANFTDPSFTAGPTSFPGSFKLDGVIGGGQVGLNWRATSNWVLGLEADIQGSAERGSRNFSSNCEGSTPGALCSQNQEAKILLFGTVRVRVGWLLDPSLLVYATGGLGYGQISAAGSVNGNTTICGTGNPCSFSYSGRATNAGYAAGGGIEGIVPIDRKWTWRVEYLYLDLGSVSGSGVDTIFPSTPPHIFQWNAKITDNVVRFALSYHYP
jgi:outer membrane immunogenic protein